MEAQVSEILENVLSLLALEGSFEVDEKEDGIFVSIDTEDAGRLIGHQGDTLSALQLIVNMILSRQVENPKRVIVDVASWRQGKEEDLTNRAKNWAAQVIEDQKPMELDPMPAWQRRVVHMVIEETDGVTSESTGEGDERRLVIKPAA